MRWKQYITATESVDTAQADSYMAQHPEGSYTLLDVRQPHEYEADRIPGAKLIPLPQIMDHLGEIDAEKPVLVYCAVGGRSRVAAQLLSGQGFEKVFNIRGGIKAWRGQKAHGPAHQAMALLRGDETAEEVVVLAYGMEEGLAAFYRAMASRTQDKEVGTTFEKLARVEEAHKDRLFSAYCRISGSAPRREEFEGRIVTRAMEGGLTPDEFLAANKPSLDTTAQVLETAMMLETQALDLYLRYVRKVNDQAGAKILLELADEEKAHMACLGRLMNLQA